jgi:membrane protease YdiL (CAAX protease family)
MKVVLLVVVATTLGNAVAFRPEWGGTWKFWLTLGGVYLALALLAVYRIWDEGIVKTVFKLKSGDFALGALIGLLLLIGTWLGRLVLTPAGSEEQAWLAYIYLMLGDPKALQSSIVLTTTLLGIAALEEIVWRAMVLDELMQRLGDRRAWPVCALLYAVSLTPTMVTLRGPAGLNPLLPLAALGCGLVWGFSARIFGRLPPLMVSHMVFTYFAATQFRLPGF